MDTTQSLATSEAAMPATTTARQNVTTAVQRIADADNADQAVTIARSFLSADPDDFDALRDALSDWHADRRNLGADSLTIGQVLAASRFLHRAASDR